MFGERIKIRAHHLGGLVSGEGGSCPEHPSISRDLAAKPRLRIQIIEGEDYYCLRCPINSKLHPNDKNAFCNPDDPERIYRDRFVWNYLTEKAKYFGVTLKVNVTLSEIQRLIEVNF